MNREIIIPTNNILPTITAIPVEVSNENEPVRAHKIALIIATPNIFKKMYNYCFKGAFTCQICSKIIPIKKDNAFVICTICNCKYHLDCHETCNTVLTRGQCDNCKCFSSTISATINNTGWGCICYTSENI